MADFYTRGAVSGKSYRRRDSDDELGFHDRVHGRYIEGQYVPREQLLNERKQERALAQQAAVNKGQVDVAKIQSKGQLAATKAREKGATKRLGMQEAGATKRTGMQQKASMVQYKDTQAAERKKNLLNRVKELMAPQVDPDGFLIEGTGMSREKAMEIAEFEERWYDERMSDLPGRDSRTGGMGYAEVVTGDRQGLRAGVDRGGDFYREAPRKSAPMQTGRSFFIPGMQSVTGKGFDVDVNWGLPRQGENISNKVGMQSIGKSRTTNPLNVITGQPGGEYLSPLEMLKKSAAAAKKRSDKYAKRTMRLMW